MQTTFGQNNNAQRVRDRDGLHFEPDFSLGSVSKKEKHRSLKDLRGVLYGLVTLLILSCTGCQTYTGETLPGNATGEKPGILGPGDMVRISFTTAPELNQSEKIESNGRLSLPLVGEVYASGKSTAQLQEELTNLYKSQLQNAEVTVTLESVAIPVVVSGEVQKPGKIVFERPATVLEAIMEAGGFTAYGDPKTISVIRQISGVQHTQIIDLSQVLRGVPSRVMYVSAGDVIYVRPRFISF